MTGNTTVVNGVTYTATASTFINIYSDFDARPYLAFDGGNSTPVTGNVSWVSWGAGYTTSTGLTKSTTFLVSGYVGDWIKLQASQPFVLKRYALVGRQDYVTSIQNSRNPKSWRLYGSNDDTNWTQLDDKVDVTWTWTGAQENIKVYTISNTTAYAYYGITINKIQGGQTEGYIVELGSVRFYG